MAQLNTASDAERAEREGRHDDALAIWRELAKLVDDVEVAVEIANRIERLEHDRRERNLHG